MAKNALDDPRRLDALYRLQLLETGPENSFDRLGRLAQRLLSAPVALVSLVDRDRQFFKSSLGLDGQVAIDRQTPLSHSFCQHVTTSGEALIVNDAPNHPLVSQNLAIRDLGVQSYLGFPVRSPDGFVLGSFCAIDHKPRSWTDADVETMRELTELVIEQIALRRATQREMALERLAEIERAKVDRKLAESAKMESLGVLAGGIAHDFNNILTAIIGNASLLRMTMPPAPNSDQSLSQIEQASRRAAELCKQMLAYSGRGRFVVEPTSLNDVIRETGRMLEISVSKSCVLRFHLMEPLPRFEADPTQISQLAMNLVVNASEAIGKRSGVVAVTTGLARVDADYASTFTHGTAVAPGDYVFLEVSDTGVGMTQSLVEKIFDPFFSTKFTGRGLGLAAVLGIMRAHKGAIKVYTEPEKGSSFRLFFPVSPVAVIPPAVSSGSVLDDWSGSGTALIVDDEESVRVIAAQIMEVMDFKVELASDGREAVEKFRNDPGKYSFVLLDLTMPHMDGEEAFRQLRQIQPGVRVLLTSGFNRQEVMSRFAGKGLAGFIQKPFEAVAMVQAVRAIFESRSSRPI